MKRTLLLITLSLITLYGFSQTKHPVSWSFSAEKIAPLTYHINLQATVKEPYHIYPQQSFDAGLGMPTKFIFEENPDVAFIGEMAEKGMEQAAGVSVPYYSKGVTFTQTVKLTSDKESPLKFTIKYMACTDQMCLPPSSKQFTFVINGTNDTSDRDEKSVASTDPSERKFVYEDFDMADTNGKIVSSRDIITQSKYTFIDFWASWCIPCRAQGRELMGIYKKYPPGKFNVIGISLDTNPAAWKKAIQADGYTWTNLSDLKGFDTAMCKKYGITAIPRNFLIDDQGRIVAMDIHGKELEDKLAELLK